MSKEVTVEWLIAHPREFVEDVQRGESVRIVEGEKTIANVEPATEDPDAAMYRPHKGVEYPFRDFDFGTPLPGLGDEAVRQLIEERDYERSGKKHGL